MAIGWEQIAGELAQNSEPAERLRLAIDEHKNMVVDNFLFGVDEQIEFAEKRIKGGESPAQVFADLRAAMAILRRCL
jgi:hypothetical protein